MLLYWPTTRHRCTHVPLRCSSSARAFSVASRRVRSWGSRSRGTATSMRTWNSMLSASWTARRRPDRAPPGAPASRGLCAGVALQDEVVLDAAGAVALVLGIEDELGLDRGGDVAVEPLTAAEVQLSGDGPVARSADDQVQVGRAPRVPAGGGDHLAGGPVGGDLVRRGLDGVDLEPALVVGHHQAAQVALGQVRGEPGVVAVGVGLPHVDLGVGDRIAVHVPDLPGEDEATALLVLAHRQGGGGGDPLLAGEVVRGQDGAPGALLGPR